MNICSLVVWRGFVPGSYVFLISIVRNGFNNWPLHCKCWCIKCYIITNIIYYLSGGFLLIICNALSFCNIVNFNNILITRIFQLIFQRNLTLGKMIRNQDDTQPKLVFWFSNYIQSTGNRYFQPQANEFLCYIVNILLYPSNWKAADS